jgi:hypothetical protein
MVKTEDVFNVEDTFDCDVFNDIMNRPLSECINNFDTKEDFCIGLVVLAGILEESPKENTRRYDDMIHLCKMLGNYIAVTNSGSVEIPVEIFCKLGVLAEDYCNN